MKKAIRLCLSMALVFGMTACSSEPAKKASESVKESEPAVSTSVSEETPGTPVEAEGGSAFKEELEKAGNTITNVAKDGDTETFQVENENGTYQVALIQLADTSKTTGEFTEKASQLQTDSYEEVNTHTADGREIRLMLNDVNSVFAIVAMDEAEGSVIVCQDIPEAARDGVVEIFQALGYPTENFSA